MKAAISLNGGAAMSNWDLLVIGAGPAGLAAACIAAEHGKRVVVLDHGELPGGQIWRGAALIGIGAAWRQRFLASGAAYLPRTAVVDLKAYEQTVIACAEAADDAAELHATSVLLATGARELLLPFPGWTLPGVVGAGGAQALLKSGLPMRGKRVVVAGTGPLILAVAAALRHAGANVLRVLEQASLASAARFSMTLWRSPESVRQAAELGGGIGPMRYRTSAWVVAAHGGDRLESVTVRGALGERTLDCDLLANGMGLVPNTELARLVGCDVAPAFGGVVVDSFQQTTVPRVYAAGEAAGVAGSALALLQGMIVGHVVAGQAPPRALLGRRARLAAVARQMHRSFALRDELRAIVAADTLVCRCEDVSFAAVADCHSARAAKLYTRCGMGPCQGRICGAALQFLRGWEADTIRLPVQPARVSTFTSPH